MINLDDEDIIIQLSELIGKDSKNGFKRLVKSEVKPEKFEFRIFCLCDFKTYVILIKNSKPSKIEVQFHFFDIKRLESLSKTQLFILTNDNRELKIAPSEAISEPVDSIYSEIDDFNTPSVIDEIISYYCSNLLNVFPSVKIKDLFDTVNIQPEMRLQQIYNEVNEAKKLKKKLQLCGCFSKSYSVHCSFIGMNCFQEVVWDVNLIYGQNGLTEFSLNDFDYVSQKDSAPLISALKYNSWFKGFHSDGIKLTHEMQDELAKVFSLPMCNIQNLTLIHTNIKPEFLQRVLHSFQASKSFKQYSLISSTNGKTTNSFTSFKSINFSRNSIEDKGLISLGNLFKEFPILCNLNTLILSKCSITSKSLNYLFASTSVGKRLKFLDLSFNSLKEEPAEFYKYLSEPNQLSELNLSFTELDVDKLFHTLYRGGCDENLEKLVLSGNHHHNTFSKISTDVLGKFIRSVKSLKHLDLSVAKLPGQIVQVVLASLKMNTYITDGFYLNLSMNDLGSSLKSFMYEFDSHTGLTTLDLSENNLDTDADILITQLSNTRVKSLSLSRNFQSTKSKVLTRVILALTTWAAQNNTSLKKLWLVDCKLKNHLNDFINELGSFSHLRLLDISGNDVGDVGVNYLSKSIQVNRSLQFLMFDKSNVSVVAFNNIMEAIKRNVTLKSIQIPITDICNLYQKSPEKINDIAKQMTELFSHRKLALNAQNKYDLDQLFKTKMKLINEPFAATSSLNTHSIPRSPSYTASMSNNQKPNDAENSAYDSQIASKINTPQYIKEILQNLNESASGYLKSNPIEQEFASFSSQIREKIDSCVFNLEKELKSTLKQKYPQYTLNQNFINEKDDSLVELNSLKNSINEYMSTMAIQIHNNICEMTYKMSATMAEKLINESQKNPSHVSQNNFKVALTPNPAQAANKNTVTELESILSSRNNNENFENNISKKPPSGGVKCLPFLPKNVEQTPSDNHQESDKNTSSGVQQRYEFTSNSKSKRPVSSQLNSNLQDTIPTGISSPGFQNGTSILRNNAHLRNGTAKNKPWNDTHNKSLSSSNENLCQSEEDELDVKKSNSSSREKTPDGFQSEPEPIKITRPYKPLPPTPQQLDEPVHIGFSKSPIENDSHLRNFKSNESDQGSLSTPVPAPRKNTKQPFLKSIFGSLGVGNSPGNFQKETQPSPIGFTPKAQASSPSLLRKQALSTPVVEKPQDIKIESVEESAEPVRLQHINKSRPRRANVKRPTKNPTKIDIELVTEDLDTVVNEPVKEVPEPVVETIVREPTPQPDTSTKKSPIFGLSNNKPNSVEQPKISLNILEGVKLRQTSKFKQIAEPASVEEPKPDVHSPSPASLNPTAKLASRFSMFEQQSTGFQHQKPTFSKKPEITEKTDEKSDDSQAPPVLTNSKINKPLPPVPPVKPPRPVFNGQLSSNNNQNKQNPKEDTTQQPSILVKLRPVQTNGNSGNTNGTKLNNELNTNLIFNNKLNLNNIVNKSSNSLIMNENNCPVGVSLSSNSENQTNGESNGVKNGAATRIGQESDKRASVRELAQMMFEESKA